MTLRLRILRRAREDAQHIYDYLKPRSRIFSVDLAGHRFQCFKCKDRGNQLDLWATAHELKLVDAAKDRCAKAGVEVPWVERW